jgi:putative transposase
MQVNRETRIVTGHRKLVRHYHEPGDLHELTFSCYRRMPLITNDVWRKLLCESIDKGMQNWNCRLVAFVLMPVHLHLLVLPATNVVKIDKLLSAVKQPYSVRIKQILVENDSPPLKRLTVLERPGKTVFRYWQEGPGYDRNLSTEKAVMAAIHYIHENPVRRGLVRSASDWKWSSARWYASETRIVDPDLPTIHGLPWDFFNVSN